MSKPTIREVVLDHSPTSVSVHGGGGASAVAYSRDTGPVRIFDAVCASIPSSTATVKLEELYQQVSKSAQIETLIIRSRGASLPKIRSALENYREQMETARKAQERKK